MTESKQPTVEDLMALVSEYGQCRWSEGSNGATYIAKAQERAAREEAADVFKQIEECAAALAAHPSKGGEAVAPFATDALETAIDSYLDDYEMVGEAPDGRDACHQPTEGERILIKDAILGLLADSEWDAEWGRLIEQRARELVATPSTPPTAPDDSSTVRQINAPDAGPMPGICGDMDKASLWAYAHLCGYRASTAPDGEARITMDDIYTLIGTAEGMRAMGQQDMPRWLADFTMRLADALGLPEAVIRAKAYADMIAADAKDPTLVVALSAAPDGEARDAALESECLALFAERQGGLIRAIKHYRNCTGCGLVRAKDAVQAMVRKSAAMAGGSK